MYVLDASVALKWVFQEPDSVAALRLRSDYLAGRLELCVPDIFAMEVAHVIAKAHRRRVLNDEQSSEFLAEVLTAMPPVRASNHLLAHAFSMALRFHAGVYDCIYVALAEDLQCEFITSDKKLVTKFAGYPVLELAKYGASS